ncbi:uroporphyrinogen-III synthase [Sphingomonas sp. Tas61C01]|uniref:uroporphyrinogen-III synthase n=1 Tax=Sphingomonas sp. Tas61C01 TaxID=3458297 RepID=UPI00403ED030
MIVVRPAPGDARTLERLAARGVDVELIPLFAVRPVAWTPPEPAAFDALLLTSANALRHGGTGLDRLRRLPVVAVGAATAAAARAAGFVVALTGDGDVARVCDEAASAGLGRLLHLAGRDRKAAGATAITVYASEALAVSPDDVARFAGATVLLHSARAATMVARLVDRDGIDRARVRLAAFSPAVAAAVGDGWQEVAIASAPTDPALIEAAIDQRPPRADK